MKINNKQHITKDGIVKRNPSPKIKWIVVYDVGIPYEVTYTSDNALEKGIRDFYNLHSEDGDFKVYLPDGIDMSESQFINEMVGEIMSE